MHAISWWHLLGALVSVLGVVCWQGQRAIAASMNSSLLCPLKIAQISRKGVQSFILPTPASSPVSLHPIPASSPVFLHPSNFFIIYRFPSFFKFQHPLPSPFIPQLQHPLPFPLPPHSCKSLGRPALPSPCLHLPWSAPQCPAPLGTLV